MSEMMKLAEEFKRRVRETESRTAKTLGEVKAGIAFTDKERREAINQALDQLRQGVELISGAATLIVGIMENSEKDTGEIIAQVHTLEQSRLTTLEKTSMIGQNKGNGTNG